MKFEPTKLSKIIEQNYSHLIPDFLEMQTEYLASLNIIYHDLDASLVAMVLTSELYKNSIHEHNKEKISLKYFYQKGSFKLPEKSLKIKDISILLNLPRETVRRKKEKIIKDNLIIYDKKNKIYLLNTNMIEQKIIDLHIDNLSRFLSKFSVFFSRNRFFVREVSKEKIKKDVEEKFLIYFTKFLDFQISYFSKMKTFADIETIFILLLCGLNTTAQIKKKDSPISSKEIFSKLHSFNDTLGLNATSISEITKVPRTTVLRKISFLEKTGMIKKDKFKRYSSDDVNKSKEANKVLSIMDHNINLLGVFFSECLETYAAKN
tara:strand:- start:821 stop:1780 length:960 start_codon:yes stop_codon:yes gene_type:complete